MDTVNKYLSYSKAGKTEYHQVWLPGAEMKKKYGG